MLASNGGANPLANSVVPTGGGETALTMPSAQQSGLKMNVDIDVAAGQIADVVLDFDACKSVVRRGNSGQYNLKPVITRDPGRCRTSGCASSATSTVDRRGDRPRCRCRSAACR